MYLLTWATGAEWLDNRREALEAYAANVRAHSFTAALFERRGNDWMRIRPEEG